MNNNIEKEEKTLKILIFIIVTLILIILDSSFMIYIKYNPKQETKKSIISKNNYYISYMNYDEIIDISETYFLVNNNNKQLIVDKNNKVLKEFDNTNYSSIKYINNYFILSNNINSIVINKNYDIFLECDGIIYDYIDLITNKIYFTVYDKEYLSIYDSSFNNLGSIKLKRYNNDIYFINDEIYLNNNIYDNLLNRIDEYEKLINLNNKIIIIENNKFNVISLSSSEIFEYNTIEFKNEHYILNNEYNTLMLDNDGNIISDLSKVKINNDYYMDFESCENGGILKDKWNNHIVYDKCTNDFDLSNILNGVIIATNYNKDTTIKKVVFHDKTIEADEATFIEDYILVFKNKTYNIYDLLGNEINIDEKITKFGKIFDNYYINNKIYDKTLTTVIEEYDDILELSNNIFKITKDGTSGLYYNNNWLINLGKYWDIDNINDYYVLYNIDGYTIINFKDLNKYNIESKNKYNNVDINKFIKKYNLQNIKDKDLLKKYIYVLNNNDNLKDYYDKLINIFKIIDDNNKYIKEDILLSSLDKLAFEGIDNFKEYTDKKVLGLYSYENNKIYFTNNEEYIGKLDHVIYHELVHYIDYNINNYKYSIDFYKCNNDYYIIDDYKKLEIKDNCKYYKSIDTEFITEGLAEKINVNYFPSYNTITYSNYIKILNTLGYIFGEDRINEIFFSENTSYEFYKLIVDENKMDIKEYINMLEVFNKIDNNNFNLIIASDYLVDLYESKNNKEWFTDNIFKALISNLLPSYISKYYNIGSNLEDYKKYSKDNKVIQKEILEEYLKRNNLEHIQTTNDIKILLVDDKYYYYINLDNKYYLVYYDFNNNIVIDFKEIT